MKTLLATAVGLFCVVASSRAETQPVEVKIPAKAFEGSSSVTKTAATECRYLTRAWSSTHVDGPIDSLRVFLNSDEESRVNIGVSVPLSDLPSPDLLSPRTARTRERTKYFGIPVRTLSELRCEF